MAMSSSFREVQLSYQVPVWSPAWAVPEIPVPESNTHDAAIEYIRARLQWWAKRENRDVWVARNLGIRWVQSEPRTGFDPDLCLLSPAPVNHLSSLRTWEADHHVPRLAIEVVSPNHPYKDYVDTPDRCAACGIEELWVYDPMLAGPKHHGGPFLLQLWRREGMPLRLIHAGEGPAYSPVVDAWLHPIASTLPQSAKLNLGSQDGQDLWLTESEHTAREAKRERKERQRLEAELERLRRG